VQDRIVARVCFSSGERAHVLIDGFEFEAIVAGTLAYSGHPLPVTGDWVAVRRVDASLVLIEEVLPRLSWISRRAAGRRTDEQVLAANVDRALIVCGLDGDFSVRRLERYLAMSFQGHVEPVVVLNKADLCADPEAVLASAREVARSARVVLASGLTGAGCEDLLRDGITAVLLGSSGAGKSTLLNRLAGREVHQTASVRESDSRGRHTTTHRELILLPSGAALIDTPGLREVQLLVSEESMGAVFDEIGTLAALCRFRDCTHTTEPDCAVRDAVPADRLASFFKLSREAAGIAGQLDEKKRWRSIHKGMKQFRKIRGR
jgi:ribosome biogenesis GTPase